MTGDSPHWRLKIISVQILIAACAMFHWRGPYFLMSHGFLNWFRISRISLALVFTGSTFEEAWLKDLAGHPSFVRWGLPWGRYWKSRLYHLIMLTGGRLNFRSWHQAFRWFMIYTSARLRRRQDIAAATIWLPCDENSKLSHHCSADGLLTHH